MPAVLNRPVSPEDEPPSLALTPRGHLLFAPGATPGAGDARSRRLDDAFRMLDVARGTKRLVQVGTQGCSDPMVHRAHEIVKSGALGRLLWDQASYCRQNPKGEWNYTIEPEATADSIDWKAWLGPAKKRPFRRA